MRDYFVKKQADCPFYDEILLNFDDYTNENKTKHNTDCPKIPDHP